MESLETRDLPAAGVTGLQALKPVLHNGVLTVLGTNRNDTIDVTVSQNRIKVLGKTFAVSQVKTIVIDGGGGDDLIRVSEAVKATTYLYGGWGADRIYGGGGKDFIFGGSGNDQIYGRSGNDSIVGGSGADRMRGGAGIDQVQGVGKGDRVSEALTVSATLARASATLDSFTTQVINELFRLMNEARRKVGAKPLSLDGTLNLVAVDYARTLDQFNVSLAKGIGHAFSGHTKPTVSARLDARQVNYHAWGENLIHRQFTSKPTPKQAAFAAMYGDGKGHGGWMNSPGHRANILSRQFTHVGLGISGSVSGGYHFTQVFISR